MNVVFDAGPLITACKFEAKGELGFEHRLEQLYRQFETGEISLEYFADELGLSIRDLYSVLEKRSLPTSNIQR